jgi:hypothetical protein
MFVRFVDELTGLHLRLMAYLRDPEGWFERFEIAKPSIMSGSRSHILEVATGQAGRGARPADPLAASLTRTTAVGTASSAQKAILCDQPPRRRFGGSCSASAA